MKRILKLIAVFVLALTLPSLMPAQDTDPRVGTWKLNLAKSRFAGRPAPKIETRTVEAQGTGYKITYDGVAADGSRIAFTFTTNFDGKPVPFVGTGVAGGADTVTVKRIDSYTETSTTTKQGKVVSRVRVVVSRNGKVATQTRRETDANGRTTVTEILVWDKQ